MEKAKRVYARYLRFRFGENERGFRYIGDSIQSLVKVRPGCDTYLRISVWFEPRDELNVYMRISRVRFLG